METQMGFDQAEYARRHAGGRHRHRRAHRSTKNKSGQRAPDMHQIRKGNAWHFGMRAHIGADAQPGLVHTVVGTAANVTDIGQTHELLHGEEKSVHADAGCLGVKMSPEIIAGHEEVEWRIAQRRGKLKAMPESWVIDLTLGYEKLKVRSLNIVKNLFGHRKAR
jgi:IS5 family transposase